MKLSLSFLLILIAGMSCSNKEGAMQPTQSEPTRSFWAAIANDEKQEPKQRSVAIGHIFERHVRKNMTLTELAETLDNPTWIQDEHVSEVTIVTGSIPLEPMSGTTMFFISVFGNKELARHNKECIGIWLIVSGEIGKKDFLSIVKKRQESEFQKNTLKAWAIRPAPPS
jgi:hypothetical protein